MGQTLVISDSIFGQGVGVAQINGTDNSEVLQGTDGDDVFILSGGADTLIGGGGRDRNVGTVPDGTQLDMPAGTLRRAAEVLEFTGIEDVFLYGGDTLAGGDGIDLIRAMGGNDMIIASAGPDTMEGSDGQDTASFADLDVSISGLPYSGPGRIFYQNDTTKEIYNLDSIEVVWGSRYDDKFHTSSGIDHQLGLGGEDQFFASLGADIYDGGRGRDQLVFRVPAVSETTHLSLLRGLGWTGPAAGDTYNNIEDVAVLSPGDFNITGDDRDNLIQTADGDDTLAGLGGNDTLLSSAGAGKIDGGAGRDRLIVGNFDWNDQDTHLPLQNGRGWTGQVAGDRLARIENVQTGSGNDRVTGDTGDNYLTTSRGDDTVAGLAGNDRIETGSRPAVVMTMSSLATTMTSTKSPSATISATM